MDHAPNRIGYLYTLICYDTMLLTCHLDAPVDRAHAQAQRAPGAVFVDDFREVGREWWPLPQIVRESGRLALGVGKVRTRPLRLQACR